MSNPIIALRRSGVTQQSDVEGVDFKRFFDLIIGVLSDYIWIEISHCDPLVCQKLFKRLRIVPFLRHVAWQNCRGTLQGLSTRQLQIKIINNFGATGSQ